MFPLGTVLFPTVVLPLHVFEPRYRALMRDCLAGGREFGVVLIERGSEVGGGDVRTGVGCVARIVEAAELDDGRWAVVAAGHRRIRVVRWLPDDPYPIAEVEDWDDAPARPGLEERLAAAVADLRRVLALAAELGRPAAPATVELSPDPAVASWQAAAVAPFGPVDHQRLLASEGPDDRVDLLASMLAEEADVLAAQLARG
jgi:uncharacterized protein